MKARKRDAPGAESVCFSQDLKKSMIEPTPKRCRRQLLFGRQAIIGAGSIDNRVDDVGLLFAAGTQSKPRGLQRPRTAHTQLPIHSEANNQVDVEFVVEVPFDIRHDARHDMSPSTSKEGRTVRSAIAGLHAARDNRIQSVPVFHNVLRRHEYG